MEVRELQQILDQHKKWLFSAPDGVRADLSGMDLRGMDLSGMDLLKLTGGFSHRFLSTS